MRADCLGHLLLPADALTLEIESVESGSVETWISPAADAELPRSVTERGLILTLRGALFISGRAELDPTIDVLTRLVTVLRGFPDSDITIEGHTDSLGSEGYNYDLSQRRADSLKRYLLAAGLIIPRIMALGRGGTRPVATNATATGRKKNSRLEVIVHAADGRAEIGR
jgi:outer membrane protein OmpA-like peptidoglycan-associated protein